MVAIALAVMFTGAIYVIDATQNHAGVVEGGERLTATAVVSAPAVLLQQHCEDWWATVASRKPLVRARATALTNGPRSVLADEAKLESRPTSGCGLKGSRSRWPLGGSSM